MIMPYLKRIKAGLIGPMSTRAIPVETGIPDGWQAVAIAPTMGDVQVGKVTPGPASSVEISNSRSFPVPFVLVLVPSAAVADMFQGLGVARKLFDLFKKKPEGSSP